MQKELAQCTFQPNSSRHESPASVKSDEYSSSLKRRTHDQFLKDNVERFLKQKADNTARLAEKIQKKKD
jgi:hypothetical protein